MMVAAAVAAVVMLMQGPPPMPVEDGKTPESAKAVARSKMTEYGWGRHEFACLESLWWHESKWDYQAASKTSSAYGIPQALTRTHGLGEDWKSDPHAQVDWGLDYIEQRYGSPCKAWEAWRSRAIRRDDGTYWGGWY